MIYYQTNTSKRLNSPNLVRFTHLTIRKALGSTSAKAVRYTMAFFLLQF